MPKSNNEYISGMIVGDMILKSIAEKHNKPVHEIKWHNNKDIMDEYKRIFTAIRKNPIAVRRQVRGESHGSRNYYLRTDVESFLAGYTTANTTKEETYTFSYEIVNDHFGVSINRNIKISASHYQIALAKAHEIIRRQVEKTTYQFIKAVDENNNTMPIW